MSDKTEKQVVPLRFNVIVSEKTVEQQRSRASTEVTARSPLTPQDTAERDPLDLIAEEFAELCRRGQTPSVTDFVVRYPEHAEDLANLLPAVGQMESLKRLRRPPTDVLPLLENMPARIGDYKIVREIGRGGMGIVFEAEQASLGRKVALKILPSAARSDVDKRERFLREAQAAARLHHTNIVPVFGVGEDGGVPYYVMQYIRGCGLDDIVHGWKSSPEHSVVKPREWRTFARLTACAADALDYAHREGILHRDVKPGNLLLDTAGHLWITDFGLAKLLDENTITATGHVLGTFQYMAPESLRGQSDGRTDVYGLGMTLYELLTGRVPYDETNPAVLVKLIGEREPPTPRSVEPRVPRDLETICLKAIAREPARRYSSAGEFAEDLRAYLVGRPIAARRISLLGRGRLWCNRNPVVAGLSAAIVLTLALSAVFGWSMYLKAKQSLASETQARAVEAGLRVSDNQRRLEADARRVEAEQANAKYQENLALSLSAIEKILDIVSKSEQMLGPPPNGSNGGPGGPGFGPPDGPDFGAPPERPPPKGPDPNREAKAKAVLSGNALLLEEVLTFYEKFAETNSRNVKLKFDAARAYRHVAEIQFALGRADKGEAAIQKAIGMFKELRDVHPEPDRVHDQLEQIRDRGESRRMRGPPR